MKDTRMIMGMPVVVEVVDEAATKETLEKIFYYFISIDERFSTYKDTSETSAINRGEIKLENASEEMKEVIELSEKTRLDTDGYFDIHKKDGTIDPLGMVKGWSINNAGKMLDEMGFKNFSIDIGGDIEVRGLNANGELWAVGVRNPFNRNEVVKVVYLGGNGPRGIATSGTYVRGQHIYNPHKTGDLEEILSLTIVAHNVYESDRFATAGFAMGREGIYFIEKKMGLEGYMIGKDNQGTPTSGFNKYTQK